MYIQIMNHVNCHHMELNDFLQFKCKLLSYNRDWCNFLLVDTDLRAEISLLARPMSHTLFV